MATNINEKYCLQISGWKSRDTVPFLTYHTASWSPRQKGLATQLPTPEAGEEEDVAGGGSVRDIGDSAGSQDAVVL
jgi:hypothetical protein